MKIPSLSRRTEPTPTDDDIGGRDRSEESARVDGSARDRAEVTGRDRTDDSGRVARPVVTERDSEQTTYRSSTAPDADGPDGDGRDGDAERRAAERAAVARAATARSTDDGPRRTPRTTEPDPTLERTLDGRTTDLDRSATALAARTDRDRTGERPLDADRTGERPVDRDGDGVADREPEPPVVAGPKPRASLLATLGLIVGVAGALFVLTGTLAGYGIALGALGAVLAVFGLMATRRRHIAGKTDALLGIALGLGAVVLGVLAMTGQFDWPTTDGDWVQRFREWLDSQFVDRF
ncbi:UbiA family prenyltransferase [Micromonospora echinofusca]|uniref:UbiA family prenyltransferase n=1 Tax=Micromonospora echinofusca TaxID=47858 RepID=UPI0034272815